MTHDKAEEITGKLAQIFCDEGMDITECREFIDYFKQRMEGAVNCMPFKKVAENLAELNERRKQEENGACPGD